MSDYNQEDVGIKVVKIIISYAHYIKESGFINGRVYT